MTKRRKRRRHYHRGEHTSQKLTSGVAKYRSGWELAYMQWLDANDNVASYEYENLIITYVSNVRSGRTRRYYPDFLVTLADGTLELVEIKPSRRVKQRTVQKKAMAAEDWCRAHGVAYKILTEHELRDLGIL